MQNAYIRQLCNVLESTKFQEAGQDTWFDYDEGIYKLLDIFLAVKKGNGKLFLSETVAALQLQTI